jgi:hypothetical protein
MEPRSSCSCMKLSLFSALHSPLFTAQRFSSPEFPSGAGRSVRRVRSAPTGIDCRPISGAPLGFTANSMPLRRRSNKGSNSCPLWKTRFSRCMPCCCRSDRTSDRFSPECGCDETNDGEGGRLPHQSGIHAAYRRRRWILNKYLAIRRIHACGVVSSGWPSITDRPQSIDIGKIEMAIVALTLVFDQVDIDIDAVGPHDRRVSLKLLPGAIAGWDCAFLIFAARMVIVELVVSARE